MNTVTFSALLLCALTQCVLAVPTHPPNCALVRCMSPESLGCPGTAYTPPGRCCPVCPTLPPNCALVDCGPPEPLGCTGAYIPPGQCCEVCPHTNCAAVACLAIDCPGAFTPPGQCCPVCPNSQCTANSCENGGRCYQTPGGTACACTFGYTGARCESVTTPRSCLDQPCQNGGSCRYTAPSPDVIGTYVCDCPSGFRGRLCEIAVPKPGRCPDTTGMIGICVEMCNMPVGCPGNQLCCSNGCGHVCMDPVIDQGYCEHDGVTYQPGETYRDACNMCTCREDGLVICTQMTCTDGCVVGDQWYDDGATFKQDCNTCTCNAGNVACTQRACTYGCLVDNTIYGEGDRVPCQGHDHCAICVCRGGNVDVNLPQCYPPPCRRPITPPGACCPICPMLYNQGSGHRPQ